MRSTKKSLIMSTVSLILCFAMLLGSTYAWFTDEVTSGTNKIVAGNLDIEVSYKENNEWVSIQGKDSLFNKNALWEPGHTEYVTLKIENKGTLALKYQMNVSPISETGGINQAGVSFKLSDYLMFGTTEASTTEPTYTRETARTAAGTAMKLNQTGLSKSSTLLAKGANDNDYPAQYVTLVVYMPETVSNEANYKTGTTAPTIDLGIKVVATQVENESDSFNNEYDKDIVYPAIDTVLTYNYFPQVSYVAQLKKVDDKAVKDGEDANVSESDNKITITSIDKSGENAFVKATFGNDAIYSYDGNGKAAVKLDAKKTTEGNFTVGGTDMESVTYDISVVATTGELKSDALFTVELFVGAGKQSITMMHGETNMSKDTGTTTPTVADHFIYNPDTGYIVMAVNHFSEFTAQYNAPVAAVGTTAFYSIATAAKAAKEGSASLLVMRDTEETEVADLSGVVLELNGKDVKLAEGSTLPAGKATDEEGKVIECKHENLTYTFTATGHKETCACGFVKEEEHTFVKGVCVCGYKSDAKLLAENANYTCRIGNKGYVRPFSENVNGKKDSALKDAKSGDIIKMIADYTTTNAFYAFEKTNDCEITIDLNGHSITVPSKVQLTVGIYNIIDASATKNGSINKVDLNNNQNRLNTITVNVYGGTIPYIATDGDNGDKTLNIYGGNVTLLEVQGSDKAGPEGTPQHRHAEDTVNIIGGSVQYLSKHTSVDDHYVHITLPTGYSLGNEISGTDEEAIRNYATSYKTYPVIKDNAN